MASEPPTDNVIFSEAEHLRLLQLLTRRAMAERRKRTKVADAADGETEAAAEENTSQVYVPNQWRLIPEGVALYDWQKECIPLWLDSGRGTVKVATGGGKTLFALAVAQRLQNEKEPNLRLVVVVPTIPLMFQWRDEILRGNIPDASIALMGGGADLRPDSDIRILICVLNSARDRLPALVQKMRWAEHMLLVVDECHRSNAEQAKRIFDSRPKYTLGLSATPEQDSEDENPLSDDSYDKNAVGQALGPIIYDFTIRQSLDAELLTPFEVWHIGLTLSGAEASEHARLSREISDLRKDLQVRYRRSRSKQSFIPWCQSQASRGGPSGGEAEQFIGLASRRKRLLYQAKARIDAALGVLSESATDPDARGIVFHESIDEIESLFLQAEAMRLPVVLEHSQLPESLRAENIGAFREGVARVIISAKSLVEGFNVPSADLGIIMASSGSVRQRIQSLGRMLRRKAGDRRARILVLYIRDTSDEEIYQKADWENIVGAERNRYFHWIPSPEGEPWPHGLEETSKPPRAYRPPSWEVDTSELHAGDAYPGNPMGLELKVDQSGNLRTEDGVLVRSPPDAIAFILDKNPHRRAHRTPAGHLIVRVDPKGPSEADWRFLCSIDPPVEQDHAIVTHLRLKRSSGKRVIALEGDSQKGNVHFALSPSESQRPEAGQAVHKLLQWVQGIELRQGVEIRDIFWDNASSYWLEVNGERIPCDEALAPLEFKS